MWKRRFSYVKFENYFLSLGIRQKSFLILASKFTLGSWLVDQTEYSVKRTSEYPALSWWYFNSRPYLNCFEQGEEFLVNALANDHLRPPSVLPYNFSVPVEEVNTWGQYGQPAYIDEVFFKGQVSHRQWLVSYPLYSCLHTRTGQAYTRPSFHSLITLLKRSEDGGRCMASEIFHTATHDWITEVF